jgi:hypothetical protein
MTISISDKNDFAEHSRFPDTTKILSRSSAMRLFELGDCDDFLWPDFQEALESALASEHRLLDHLRQSFWPAVYAACATSIKTRKLASTHTVLLSPFGERRYMPILSRVDIAGNDSAIFNINFVQVAAGSQAIVRNRSVARVFTALNLAHRFRWEIIVPYRDPDELKAFVEHQPRIPSRNGKGGGTNGSERLLAVWEAILLLETESRNRGVYDLDALPGDFPGAEERVRHMFSLWIAKRQQLEQAAQTGDVAAFARGLSELDPINVDFISLASERLGDLVRTDASRGTSMTAVMAGAADETATSTDDGRGQRAQ